MTVGVVMAGSWSAAAVGDTLALAGTAANAASHRLAVWVTALRLPDSA
jgi:hypothetical protein